MSCHITTTTLISCLGNFPKAWVSLQEMPCCSSRGSIQMYLMGTPLLVQTYTRWWWAHLSAVNEWMYPLWSSCHYRNNFVFAFWKLAESLCHSGLQMMPVCRTVDAPYPHEMVPTSAPNIQKVFEINHMSFGKKLCDFFWKLTETKIVLNQLYSYGRICNQFFELLEKLISPPNVIPSACEG